MAGVAERGAAVSRLVYGLEENAAGVFQALERCRRGVGQREVRKLFL